MTADESVVHAFAAEALTRGQPSDQAFEAARVRFGLEKVLSLLAICGYYSTLALVLNTAQPPLPEGTAPPLSVPRTPGGDLP
jgi:4-carboxymuconolactone decarboxylase